MASTSWSKDQEFMNETEGSSQNNKAGWRNWLEKEEEEQSRLKEWMVPLLIWVNTKKMLELFWSFISRVKFHELNMIFLTSLVPNTKQVWGATVWKRGFRCQAGSHYKTWYPPSQVSCFQSELLPSLLPALYLVTFLKYVCKESSAIPLKMLQWLPIYLRTKSLHSFMNWRHSLNKYLHFY